MVSWVVQNGFCPSTVRPQMLGFSNGKSTNLKGHPRFQPHGDEVLQVFSLLHQVNLLGKIGEDCNLGHPYSRG